MSSETASTVLPRPDFIDDGYNETTTFPASQEPGNEHGELTVTFRPCYGIDREAVIDALAKSRVDYFKAVAEALPKYIVGWSSAEPRTKTTIERMQPALRGKLADLVFFNIQPTIEASLKN